MTLASLLNRPCTIIHRDESGSEDADGNDIPTETTVTTVCELQQRRRDEPDAHGEVSDSEWLLIFLPDESVRTGDAVTVDSETYELVGDPWRARNPRTGETEHIEATARRTAGSADEVGS